MQDNDDDRIAVERFNKNHPWRRNTKDLSSLGILNKMQERIDLAKWTDNGMQGLLYDLEIMINDCYMQIKKGIQPDQPSPYQVAKTDTRQNIKEKKGNTDIISNPFLFFVSLPLPNASGIYLT